MNMKKFIFDIINIRSINLKYCVHINSENDNKSKGQDTNFSTISRFSYNNTEYVKLTPRPYVVFSIDGKNSYESKSYVNMPYMGFYAFRHSLHKVLNNIYSMTDLFVYHRNILVLNKEKSSSASENIQVNGKNIMIYPIVISDPDNSELQFEGIGFSINSYSVIASLTIDEAITLYECLKDINMAELSTIACLWFQDTTCKKKVIPTQPIQPIRTTESISSNFSSKNEPFLPDI